MMNREKKKKGLYLGWLALAVLAVVFVAPALAQDDPNMQEEPQLPGTIEGTGTYFEVTDSNYLNITLESSEPVNLRLESISEMIIMDINTMGSTASTQLTLTGFPASTTYYKYEDNYHNGVTFTTDDNGSYTFAQDLSQPHHVFIQTYPSTIFIPTDTSVGTWDPITRTYTLTSDVYETIQIDEDNLTLDGDGHTVTGPGSGYGVYLYTRTDVTIENLNVQGFGYGIYLNNSSNNTLKGNTTSNNRDGIRLYPYSNSNILTNNTANSNSRCGISLSNSSNNTLTGNTANSNSDYGIYVSHSYNTLTDNTTSNNHYGIYVGDYSSYNNTLTGNTASNNETGIRLSASSGNTLTNNTMLGNRYNFTVFGYFVNNIDTSNTVDGKPVYYVVGSTDEVYDSSTNAGTLYFINCNNITIKDLTLTNNGAGVSIWNTHNSRIENVLASNNEYGILLNGSSNNTLTGNTASNNYKGIDLHYSSNNILTSNTTSNNSFGIELYYSNNNTLTGNTASDNSWGIYFNYSNNNTLIGNTASNSYNGIDLSYSNNYNKIYNNNFINNSTQAKVGADSVGNVFNLDKPVGGNYWSDWTSPDNDNDGFIDYPYVFMGGQDNLPWIRPFPMLVIDIDIKPGSYPNAINLGSYGLVPVAILSDEDFDATTVNPDTVELAGAGVEVRGKSNKYMAHTEDVNGDGLVDLLLQVATQNLDPDSFQDGFAVLTGKTYDGVSIEGQDEITIVPPEP